MLPEFTALENVCIPAMIGKNKKKEIYLKYEIQFKDSTIKHNNMLNELDKEYSVFNKLYNTITNENVRIKEND